MTQLISHLITVFSGHVVVSYSIIILYLPLFVAMSRLDTVIDATFDAVEYDFNTHAHPPAGAAKVPSPLKKVVVLFGGVGTPPPTVAVIVATLAVAIGVENVCMPVKVCAASVLAIVALVVGKV